MGKDDKPKGDGWRKQIVAINPKTGLARPLTKADGSAIDKPKPKK